MTTMSKTFKTLKRDLWIRLALVGTLFIGWFALYAPAYLQQAIGGVMVGAFFMGSLMYCAEHPRGKSQIVFSLTRMALLAYLIVRLGEFRATETAVVIGGFLSYKVGLVMEYIRQALPGLRGIHLLPKPEQLSYKSGTDS
jgi:hypothetical protein